MSPLGIIYHSRARRYNSNSVFYLFSARCYRSRARCYHCRARCFAINGRCSDQRFAFLGSPLQINATRETKFQLQLLIVVTIYRQIGKLSVASTLKSFELQALSQILEQGDLKIQQVLFGAEFRNN